MALVAVPPFQYPAMYAEIDALATYTHAISTTGDKVALVMQLPESLNGKTIKGVFIGVNTFSSFAGSDQVDVDFAVKTVDLTTGLPTSTNAGSSSPLNVSYTSGTIPSAGSWIGGNLVTAASVNPGDIVALVAEVTNHVNTAQINVACTNGVTGLGLPYGVLDAGKNSVGRFPSVVASLSDDSLLYCPEIYAHCSSISSYSVNNSSSGDHFGNRFQVPFDCEVSGGFVMGLATGADWSAELWSGDTVIGSTGTIDGDIDANAAETKSFHFTQGPVSLTKDTTYRLIVTPESATNLASQRIELGNQNDLPQPPRDLGWGGNQWYRTDATDPTAAADFTDTLNEKFPIGLWVTKIHDGAGGGGGLPWQGLVTQNIGTY